MRIPDALVRAAMRRRSRLPDATWPTLLRLASLVPSELPVVGPPRGRRVLVVAPHPDDETIGCGGTLALLAEQGAQVTVVVATDGEATIGSSLPADATAVARRAEAVEACEVLGVPAPVFLGLPDGGLAGSRHALVEGLGRAVSSTDPDLVLAPWPLDRHADHRCCAEVVGEVVGDRTDVWGYEAHVPLTATRAVDITSVVDRKRRALRAHATAGLAMDLEATLGLNRWRSIPVTGGRGHAEAFLGLTARDWRHATQLAATLPVGQSTATVSPAVRPSPPRG